MPPAHTPNLLVKVRAFLYKTLMLLLTLAVSADLSLRFIGLVNRWVFKGRFKTATLFYLADQRYLESVTFKWYAKSRRWMPVLGGVFSFSGSGGFICVMGCNEADFCDPSNTSRVMDVFTRMERIASLLRVSTASYSGILPSVLARLGVEREPIEADRTVKWVLKAVSQVQEHCQMPMTTPIVILGSEGHIGKRLTMRIARKPIANLIELDSRREDHDRVKAALSSLPPVIFVNAARDDALDQYIDSIPLGSTVLNEVYPECRASTLTALKVRNIRYFHICGVAAASLPHFPRAYAGAVPCCAASAAASSSTGVVKPATVVLRES